MHYVCCQIYIPHLFQIHLIGITILEVVCQEKVSFSAESLLCPLCLSVFLSLCLHPLTQCLFLSQIKNKI